MMTIFNYDFLSKSSGNVILRFNAFGIYKNFFVRAEYQQLSLESKYFNPAVSPSSNERFGINNIYVGGGIRTPIGQRGYAYLLVLWNLNESIYSPYSNPSYGISFEF